MTTKERPKILHEIQARDESAPIKAGWLLDVNKGIVTVPEAATLLDCSVQSVRTYMTDPDRLPLRLQHLGGRFVPIPIGRSRHGRWESGEGAPLFYVFTLRMINAFKLGYEAKHFPVKPWQDELDQILTVEDALQIFDISHNRLRGAVRAGELPVKHTKRPLLLITDVADFVDNLPIKPYSPGSRAKFDEKQVLELRALAKGGQSLTGIQGYVEEKYEQTITRSALSRMLRAITYAGVEEVTLANAETVDLLEKSRR